VALEKQKRPTVLLAATLWWPASARLALRFIEYGCRVVAICPRGHLLTHVVGIEKVHYYDRLSSLRSLELAVRQERPDFLVPCDDRAVWQAHELHESRPDLRPLLEGSLGAPAGYRVTRHRARLLGRARELGVRVPETVRVESERDVEAWFRRHSSAVLKLDDTWGGDGVKIVRSKREAIAAYTKLSRLAGIATACKRMIINQDPLSLWDWGRRTHAVITIQRVIDGRPANAMIACWRGELLDMVTVEVLASQGATGAALMVRVVDNAEVVTTARRLVEDLKLTGFCGLDFMVEAGTGAFHLIEMNPRCTQLGHLAAGREHDLAGVLFAKLAGLGRPPAAAPIRNKVIAFFPQADAWTPRSPFLHSGHHDVPWQQPDLMREISREPWPDRQWRARLYHWVNPSPYVPAMEFEADGPLPAPAEDTSPQGLAADLSRRRLGG
jgi:ATP-grasp domain